MRPWLGAVLIGAWAAAVALSPSWKDAAIWVALPVTVLLVGWTISAPRRWMLLFFIAAILCPPLPLPCAIPCAVVGVLVGAMRLAEWRPTKSSVLPWLFAFFCILAGSSGLAALYSGFEIAARSLARVALFGMAVYIFLYTRSGPESGADPRRFARALLAIAVIAAAFACVDFYYQFPAPQKFGPQFVWLDSGVFRRAQGLFYEASTLGNFCAFFLVMIAVSLTGRPFVSRPILALAAVVFSAALMLSYSRASLMNVAVAVCALAYVRGVKLRKMLLIGGGGAVVAGCLVYALFPDFARSYWLRLSATFEYFWSSTDRVLSGRPSTWRVLVDFVVSHPWNMLLGIGYKTLPYAGVAGAPVIADNTYLSLLVETGVAGLGALIALNTVILRSSFLAARSARPVAAFFGTWMFCFWAGEVAQMMSGDLITYWRVLPLYFWALGVAERDAEEAV